VTLSGNTTIAAGFEGTSLSGNGSTLAIAGTTTFQSGLVRLALWTNGNIPPVLRVNANAVLDAVGETGIASTVLTIGSSGSITALGTVRKSGTGTLTLYEGVTYDIAGTVDVQAGTLLIRSSSNLLSHSANTLTKGTWLVSNGTLDFNGRTVETLGTLATMELSGSTATFTALNSLTQNNGTLRILGGHTFTPTAATVNNAGLIEIGSGSTFAKSIAVQNNGILRGSGAVTGNLTAQSGDTVAPGTTTSTGNGYNQFGQVGDRTTTNRQSPVASIEASRKAVE
jgi:fibronectin-binding autotransporter adhesin